MVVAAGMDVEKGRSASRTGPLSLIAQLSRQGPPKEGSSAGSAIHHAGLTHLSHALFSSVFTALEVGTSPGSLFPSHGLFPKCCHQNLHH